MVKKQLLFALRRLGRHKLNTTINVLGLTLGILACLVIYLFVSFEFSYDKFHPEGDRIYRVVRTIYDAAGEGRPGAGLTPPLATDLRRESTGFSTIASVYCLDSRVIVPNAAANLAASRTFAEARPGEPQHMAFVEPSFLNLFPRKWLAGNPATALNSPFSVVLTRSGAERYFGGNNPQQWMGRTLVYHDSLRMSVTGVVEDWTHNSDLPFTDLLSFTTIGSSFLQKDMNGWNMWESIANAYVRLAPGVTAAQAEQQFPAFFARHSKLPKEMKGELHLQPLSDIHFNADYNDTYGRRAHKPTLYALIGIASFILLIASINFINLSTAQAVQRSREVGVRKVLGSGRLGLTTQFLVETALIVAAAMTLALGLANPVIHALHGFIPAGVALNPANPVTLGFIGLTGMLTCLIAGWYPARVLSAFLPVISLRGQGSRQLNSRSYLRRGLITDSAGAYIINESAAKALGFRRPADALGKTLTCGWGGLTGPVVGIVKDFHAESYREAIKPFFYIPNQGRGDVLSLKLTATTHTADEAKTLLGRLEHSFKAIFPDANFNARFFDESIAKLYASEQKTSQIMNLAMAIAIFISCMGLFGLAAYTAGQRTREIGIRKVLGATVPHLVSLLSRDFVVLVLLSTFIAAPIAGWAMHKWLEDFVYRTSVPWFIYAIAGLGAVVIALITVSFQAIRAATANPVDALRSE